MTGGPSTPALRELQRLVERGYRIDEVGSSEHHVILVLRDGDRRRTVGLDPDEALLLCESEWLPILVLAA